jgi:hypothetical protein
MGQAADEAVVEYLRDVSECLRDGAVAEYPKPNQSAISSDDDEQQQ